MFCALVLNKFMYIYVSSIINKNGKVQGGGGRIINGVKWKSLKRRVKEKVTGGKREC